MSKTLEQRLDENREYAIDLKVAYDNKVPQGLYRAVEVPIHDTTNTVSSWFPMESARFKKLSALGASHQPGTYLLIKTDSSNITLGIDVYEILVSPRVMQSGHNDDFGMLCVDEMYKNSVIFAHRASTNQEDYKKRGRNSSIPTREELAENQNKPIYLEFLITQDYVLTRLTDSGPGFDINRKIREAKEKRDKLNQLREAIQKENKPIPPELLLPHGRGLLLVNEITGERPILTKTNSCSISYIRYKENPISESYSSAAQSQSSTV